MKVIKEIANEMKLKFNRFRIVKMLKYINNYTVISINNENNKNDEYTITQLSLILALIAIMSTIIACSTSESILYITLSELTLKFMENNKELLVIVIWAVYMIVMMIFWYRSSGVVSWYNKDYSEFCYNNAGEDSKISEKKPYLTHNIIKILIFISTLTIFCYITKAVTISSFDGAMFVISSRLKYIVLMSFYIICALAIIVRVYFSINKNVIINCDDNGTKIDLLEVRMISSLIIINCALFASIVLFYSLLGLIIM